VDHQAVVVPGDRGVHGVQLLGLNMVLGRHGDQTGVSEPGKFGVELA